MAKAWSVDPSRSIQLARYAHAEARRTALDRVGRDLRTVGAAVERSLAEGA